MSQEPSDFKPLPRRSSSKRRSKRTVVGAGTPSAPRRATRARSATATADAPPSRSARRRSSRRRPAGWLKYVALLIVVGIGGFMLANLSQRPASSDPTTAVAASAVTPPNDFSISDANATPGATPGSLFSFFQLPSLPTAGAAPRPTPLFPDIAIVAGHYAQQSNDAVPAVLDTGATCPDGLREVDITKSVADKTLADVAKDGYFGTLLQEFDPRYKTENPDFAPRVFLSIHADSCLSGADYPYATGYKIAHAEPSDNAVEDDRLVKCLTRDFGDIAADYDKTFNANTITLNMTEYHAFHKIKKRTPAAIIELGFLGNDREFLVNHQDEMAQGLASGLEHYLTGSPCDPPTPTPRPTRRPTPP